MELDYINYCIDSAKQGQFGTGLNGFHGVLRYQGHGRGIFKSLFRTAILPALKFLGKSALKTGANIANDTIINKRDFKESAKEHLTNAGKDIANTGLESIKKKFIGEGRRRGRVNKKKKSIKRVTKKELELMNFL